MEPGFYALTPALSDRLKKSGKKRNKCSSDEGNTTSGHELLHSLALCAGIIIAVSFHEVDCSPNSKTCTKCYNECLKYAYCAIKKCHIVKNQKRR